MTVDEIYLNIGQSIAGAIEEDSWTSARLYIEITGIGVVGYTGDYNVGAAKYDISIRKIPRDIRSWVRALYEITTEDSSNKWNKSVFTLTPDGKFNMEFIWDQKLQDEIERLAKK